MNFFLFNILNSQSLDSPVKLKLRFLFSKTKSSGVLFKYQGPILKVIIILTTDNEKYREGKVKKLCESENILKFNADKQLQFLK